MSNPDLQSRPSLAPGVRLQMDPVTGEPVLLYPEGFLILNSTAHEIVLRCRDRTSVDEIILMLSEEYEADVEEMHRDVLETLSDLKQRKLVTFSP